MDYEETNGGGESNNRIYVSNLDYRCAWQDLKDFFNERIGDVAHANVTPGKGWGIVEFNSPDAARRAMEECNDQEWRGRPLHIREDRESDRGGSRSGIGSYSASDGFTPDKDARVYVGNLVWQLTKEELVAHMSQGGEVKACEILKNHNGKAKGCAIVQYASEADAESAKNKLNNTDLKGRMISVREDREQGISTTGTPIPSASRPAFRSFPSSGGRSGGFQGHGGGGHWQGGGHGGGGNRRVYVGNLSYEVSWQDLKDHFRPVGQIVHADIFRDQGGRSKGSGIVEFDNPGAANRAIKSQNDSELKGRRIFVREDRDSGPPNVHFSRGGWGGQGRGGYQERPSWGGNYQGSSDSTSTREERVLIVEGLDPETKWTELKDHFAQFNPQRVDIFPPTDESTEEVCNGIVRFKTVEDANAALNEKNGSALQGKEGYAIGLRMDEKI